MHKEGQSDSPIPGAPGGPPQPNTEAAKVSFVSLGCPKALVDSEHIVTALQDSGYQVVAEDDQDAQVVVINTCGFIDAAKQESIDAISRAYADERQVVVTGCMGKDPAELQDQFTQLLSISGPAEVQPVMDAVQTYLPPLPGRSAGFSGQPGIPGQRIRLTPEHYAYLKISEGCNHKCAFCIIPQMRGKLRSRDITEVLEEAQTLVADGVKELLVVAQDLSAYGVDLGYRTSLHGQREIPARLYELCESLGQIAPWVRLHYVYPYPHVDAVIPLMRDGLLLPYLDMPLQHASVPLLKQMRRPAATAKTLERIQRWRELCPELVIRSTFIVGFPGETDEDLGELLDFLQAAELDRVGCFTYSAVDGAAANKLDDHVDESVKLDRQEMVYELQSGISAKRLQRHVGTSLRVLVDEVDQNGQAVARSFADAPEIDGLVHVTGDKQAAVQAGEFAWVQIDRADDHDLYGHFTGRAVQLSDS